MFKFIFGTSLWYMLIYTPGRETRNDFVARYRVDSRVLFACLFLFFGQIDNIYKVEQNSLYFLHYLSGKFFLPFARGFRDMIF